MRYKTLFGLLVKAMGVLMLGEGISYWLPQAFYVLQAIREAGTVEIETFRTLLYPTLMCAIGGYLFLDGRWVVNRAFPSDRPYCPECGYELTGIVSGRCPECGHVVEKTELEIPADDAVPGHRPKPLDEHEPAPQDPDGTV
jgi:hypothetical protein